MKNRGFVFVETIVVIAILTVSLLTIYLTFTNVLENEKRRATFDDTAYIYKTYYIEDFLVSLYMDKFINTYLGAEEDGGFGKEIAEFTCNLKDSKGNIDVFDNMIYDSVKNEYVPNYEDQAKIVFCESLINNNSTMNVKAIYITNYNVNNLKNCTTAGGKVTATCRDGSKTDALNSVDTNFIYYLRTLSSSNDDDNLQKKYRLIVEYEETEEDDANPIDVNKNTGNCIANYEKTSDGKCIKKVVKDYYSSVVMVTKGEK